MPRGNSMGPVGQGPMTGRAAGLCRGSGIPGYANRKPGYGIGMSVGRGRGFGGGRGWRHWFYATGLSGWMRSGRGNTPDRSLAPHLNPGPDAERQVLENRAAELQSELDAIKKRLSEIETGNAAQ